MSVHIGAKAGQVAPTVLLPGDPRRAQFIAETLLKEAECITEVRGMLGFTGKYKGTPVSVMGTGMGIPSHSIYVHELINDYQAKRLIRVGTCGAMQAGLDLGDIILAMTASTDSQFNKLTFSGRDYAPTASFNLLMNAWKQAQAYGMHIHVGGVLSSDAFYNEDPEWWKLWAQYGILAAEMETAGLYTLAARFNVEALAILTVSDNILTGGRASAEERERGFADMAKLALELAL